MEEIMKEFKWKNNFINQDKKTEHINKYVLLLLMVKLKCQNTKKLEENIASLEVQDFSVYEEFLIDHVLPESEKVKKQSRLLHNQPFFKDLIESIEVDKPLRTNFKYKRLLFSKFSKYVNLKDLTAVMKTYWAWVLGLFSFFYMASISIIFHNILYLTVLNLLEVFIAFSLYRTFRGKSKLFCLNIYRINTELCLIELQKEFEELENILKVSNDPYKNDTFEETYEKFKNMFSVPEDFLDICINKSIIDENNFVNSKYNHFMIQYLKIKRNEKYRNEKFDWQLIKHVIVFEISKSKKSDFLKNDFKMDLKTREYYSPEGIKFQKFLNLFE